MTSYTGNGTTQAYPYDANGNRTNLSIGGASYSNTIAADSNRLLGTTGPVPPKTNTYDLAGNLTNDATVTYTYTSRGRMSSATVGTAKTSYLYNGLGQCVRQVTGTAANPAGLLVYDEAGHIIGEYNSSTGKASKEFVYLGDTSVGVLEQVATGTAPNLAYATNVYFIYPDHLDTPRVITRSPHGQMVWRWDSGDPFGLLPPNDNPAGFGVFTFNLRMPGQYYDKSTNLFYNYFRDYDPQLGRYVQSDPIGLAGGLNTYAYVGADPLRYRDSLGLAPKRFGKNHPHCKGIRRKMTGLQNEMDTRWAELAGGLPERIGPGERLAETMRGHRKLINKADSNLRYWEKKYAEDCDDGDDSEDGKGNICEVCPSGRTVAKAASGIGAAYIAYRCIRMLPSLAPPLWWTIRANTTLQ